MAQNRIDLIIAKLQDMQWENWRNGQPVRVEELLEDEPELANAREIVAALLVNELCIRSRLGEQPSLDEYYRRFPSYGPLMQGFFAAETVFTTGVKEQSLGQIGSNGRVKEPADENEVTAAAEQLRAAPSSETDAPSNTPLAGPLADGSTGATAESPDHSPTLQWLPRQKTAAPWPVVEGYEIHSVLGRGGMGVVYKARELSLNRLVALKMISSGNAGSDERARFQLEAEAVARLKHPNIVQIYRVGQSAGDPYLALEFIDGCSLDLRFRSDPPAPREVAGMVEVISRAVQYAHDQGIVHRDLKPSNVLVTPEDELKLSDFGLAKRLDAAADPTLHGAVIGTPAYMAPEQAASSGSLVGPLADVYSLGAVLYAGLTGRPPFRGATTLETLDQVRNREPVAPRQLQPSVERDLETICLKCLQKDPARRYSSAAELADDLRRYIERRPVRARPVPLWQHAARWARRKPAVASLTVALVLAVIGSMAGVVFFGMYESQQAKALEIKLDRQHSVEEQWLSGQQAEAAGQLEGAKECFDKALATFEADRDPAQANNYQQIAAARDLVVKKLRERLAAQDERHAAQKTMADKQQWHDKLAHFEQHRDEILYHAVNVRNQDARENARRICEEGPQALQAIGCDAADSVEDMLAALRESRQFLTFPEFQRLSDSCSLVLLLWADAETSAAVDAEQHLVLQHSLKLFDVAAAACKASDLPLSASFHARRGQLLARLGDLAAAAAENSAATAAAKISGTALDSFCDGLHAYKKGDLPRAIECCEKCILEDQDNFWAAYLQSLCFLKGKRWAEARVALTQCLSKRPDFCWARILRAAVAGELGQQAIAEVDFNLALAHSPDAIARWSVLVTRSVMWIRFKQWSKAVSDLRQAIAERPDAAEAYINLAMAYESEGRPAEARTALDQAIARRGNDAALYRNRARLRVQQEDFSGAEQDFSKAVAHAAGPHDPQLANDQVELGRVQHHEKQFDAALASFQAALHAQPECAAAFRQMAETFLALKRFGEAGRALDDCIRNGERTPEIYLARGIIHVENHEYTEAIESFNRSLDFPTAKTAKTSYCSRGWTYLRLDSPKLALSDFEAAIHIDGQYSDALCGHGHALLRLGRVEEGIADVETAIKLDAKHAQLLFSVACFYARAYEWTRKESRASSALESMRRYEERSYQLLDAALKQLPQEERKAFWVSTAQNEHELLPFQGTRRMQQLSKQYGAVSPVKTKTHAGS